MPWVSHAAWPQIKMQGYQTARMPQEQQAPASGTCQGELEILGLYKAGIWRMSLQRALAYGDPRDRPYAAHDPRHRHAGGRQHQHPDGRAAWSGAAAGHLAHREDGAFRRRQADPAVRADIGAYRLWGDRMTHCCYGASACALCCPIKGTSRREP